jgi:4-amino-4-deoxy-L-arabinose transferase-like glycosyltransferase
MNHVTLFKVNKINPPKYWSWFYLTVSLVLFLITFGFVAYRLNQAPDIFTDEIIYTRIGARIAGEGAMVWDSGNPFIVHPPLYFLLEGAYHAITGDPSAPIYSPGDIFASVYHARYLNAFFAGLTAVVLFWFGKRLHGKGLGFLLVVIFILDPFGIRTNRRAMLETLAGLLSVAGIGMYLSAIQEDLKRRSPLSSRLIFGGLLLGFALLSKELTFINLVVVYLYGVIDFVRKRFFSGRGAQIAKSTAPLRVFLLSLSTIVIAGFTYALYFGWIIASGMWGIYASEKFLGFERLLGLVQLTGWNRPGVSFLTLLLDRLSNYGSSYMVLALGGASVLGLLIWGRKTISGRFLIVWGFVIYPFFAFLAFAGSGNDQFFYFLLLPAIIFLCYGIITFPEGIRTALPMSHKIPSAKQQSPLHRLTKFINQNRTKVQILFTAVLLLVILPFNIYRWFTTFGVGQDNGYAQFKSFVEANVPIGDAINASGDPIKFQYFFPDRQIYAAATSQEAVADGVHFFALAPKDVALHYGKITQELSDWIQSNGTLLFSVDDPSYGNIYLYQVDYPDNPRTSPTPDASSERSFQPAEGGFVGSLVLLLLLWSMLWMGLAVLIHHSNTADELSLAGHIANQGTGDESILPALEKFDEALVKQNHADNERVVVSLINHRETVNFHNENGNGKK